MGYFNPIVYFIKSFIRIFTKKFFWIIFICLGIFVGYLLFNNGVFAESSFYLDESYFTEANINSARSQIGSSIWDNEEYDIFLGSCRWSGYYANGYYNDKVVLCFKPDLTNTNCSYIFNTGDIHSYNFTNINSNYYGNYLDFCLNNNANSSVSVSNYYIKSINRYEPLTQINNGTFNNSSNVGFYGSYSVNLPQGWDVNRTNNYAIKFKVIRSHYNIYDSDGNLLSPATHPMTVSPYFITTDEQLQTFDFDYLQINGGTTPYYTEISDGVGGNATLSLKYIYSGVQTNIDLTNYITVNSDNTWSVNIPYNALTNSVIVRNGQEFSYVFTYTPFYGTQEIVSKLNLTYTLTSEEEEQINQDSEKQVQSDILQEQKDINQSINDSHVDDITSDTLPADNTNDITSDGVNSIFTSIYTAFCTGEAQDIVFPVPFTDKSFTIKPDYVSSMLTSINASFIITLIQAFWWYLISRYIIKDIMDKINKIKSGNIENIETTNIRGDML